MRNINLPLFRYGQKHRLHTKYLLYSYFKECEWYMLKLLLKTWPQPPEQ